MSLQIPWVVLKVPSEKLDLSSDRQPIFQLSGMENRRRREDDVSIDQYSDFLPGVPKKAGVAWGVEGKSSSDMENRQVTTG